MSGLFVFPGGFPPLRPHPLTGRELEVVELAAHGKRSAEIAETLGISPRTVRTHRHHILAKLRVPTMTAAVYLLVKEGLVKL